MGQFKFFLLILLIGATYSQKDEESAKKFLKEVDKKFAVDKTRSALASWAYDSNITDANLEAKLKVDNEVAANTKALWKEIISYPYQTYKDPDVRRQFHKLSILGAAALPADKFETYNKVISEMQSIYAKGKICDFHDPKKCDLALEPEMTDIMANSKDPEELKHVWVEWRKVTGSKVRDLFAQYVDLSNEAARLNNFTNNAEYWLDDFEDPNFTEDIKQLWLQLKPLYLQIHAYVRRELRLKYGEKVVSKNGPIPAHLLGNMWAQTWGNLFQTTAPYPDVKGEDITKEMQKQGYTAKKMFQVADDFFQSINLTAMPRKFWENSILEKPNDGRELICHASAWDFYDGEDFRIKQCTTVTLEEFETAHHEMGHIEYYLQYRNQPQVYREGANSGFHEAVGDTISLSVSTNKHLAKIGLLQNFTESPEATLNALYRVGLDKIVFLPFGLLMDLYRWDIFRGNIAKADYNKAWWKLRNEYQGVDSPVPRTEEDFDAGAKYHTIANVPYARYFVSFVVQFQFHKALCEKAGQYEPNNPEKALHNCDIYKSTEAGNALGRMLQLGSSLPWQDAMEVLTGQRKMDASALLEYFKPLQSWLEKENKKNGEYIGWVLDGLTAVTRAPPKPTTVVISSTEKSNVKSTKLETKHDKAAFSGSTPLKILYVILALPIVNIFYNRNQ